MKTSGVTNKLIDWKTAKGYEERKGMFVAYQEFFLELEKIKNSEVKALLRKWNVYFIDADDFPRINMDKPC